MEGGEGRIEVGMIDRKEVQKWRDVKWEWGWRHGTCIKSII